MSNPYPPEYPGNAAFQIIANASNVKVTTNPAYVKATFLADFPQFTGLVSDSLLNQFIAMATASISYDRWHAHWQYAMGLYVAHFATLFLEMSGAGAGSTAAQVIASAQARGLVTSESVGDVSASYDFSSITKDLDGWANWLSTAYGLQLATLAKSLGKGGMYVW